MACLLNAWAEELPAHSAARRRGARQADSAAVCSSPHQDAGSDGRLDPGLRRVCDRDSIMRLLAGCWPQPAVAASLIPKEHDPEHLFSERESEPGRKTMRVLARMCVWDDASDEKCLTPGESDVPEREWVERSEDWLTNPLVAASTNVCRYWQRSKSILCASAVPL